MFPDEVDHPMGTEILKVAPGGRGSEPTVSRYRAGRMDSRVGYQVLKDGSPARVHAVEATLVTSGHISAEDTPRTVSPVWSLRS